MSLIHPNSCKYFHSGRDFFSVLPIQTAVQENQFVEIYPQAFLEPTELVIQRTSEDYVDLFNTILYVRAKVALPRGDNIPP